MATPSSVTITLRGKSYVISTSEQEQHVTEAAQLLDQTMQKLVENSGILREDRLTMFSALQALVAVIKERDECLSVVNTQVNRLEAALAE